MPAPSNADIMRELGAISATLSGVAEQTKKTNGRVTRIEEWKNALEAVEAYKDKQVPIAQTEKGNIVVATAQANYLEGKGKMLAGAGAVLVSIASLIGYVVGQLAK